MQKSTKDRTNYFSYEKYIQIEQDRRIHNKPNKFPQNCFGLLLSTFPNEKCTGTGFLVAPDLVITCAHNLVSRRNSSQIMVANYSKIHFYPAVDGQIRDQQAYEVVDFRYHLEYDRGVKQRNFYLSNLYDFALLKLNKKVSRQKYIELGYNFSDTQAAIQVSGYPSQKIIKNVNSQQAYLHGHKGTINRIEDQDIFHLCDTTPGQSGSAIIVQKDDITCAIGVHLSGLVNQNCNFGQLFTEESVTNFSIWQKEMMQCQIKFRDYQNEGNLSKISFDIKPIDLMDRRLTMHLERDIKIQPLALKHKGVSLTETEKSYITKQFEWDFTTSWASNYKVQGNIIKSINQNKFYQITTIKPLQKQSSTNILFKIKSTGPGKWYMGFGLITQTRKSMKDSGRFMEDHKQSVGYWSWKNDNVGWINVDGKRVQQMDKKYVLDNGDQLQMNVDLNQMTIEFIRNRKSIFGDKKLSYKAKLGSLWKEQRVFPFLIMYGKDQEVQFK